MLCNMSCGCLLTQIARDPCISCKIFRKVFWSWDLMDHGPRPMCSLGIIHLGLNFSQKPTAWISFNFHRPAHHKAPHLWLICCHINIFIGLSPPSKCTFVTDVRTIIIFLVDQDEYAVFENPKADTSATANN